LRVVAASRLVTREEVGVDQPGFQEFVAVRYADLLRTAYLLVGSRDGAEDLLQSALLATMRHWRSVEDPMAYVRRAMVNQRTSLWRRFGSRELLTATLPERGIPDGAGMRADRDESLAALARLPARMRAVLVLRYWEDLSEAETGRDLTVGLLSGVGGTAGVRPRRPRRCHRWRCPGRSGGLGSGRAG
jgi:RNA polymerase sigma-70 factor (sigma-E family)